MGRPRIHADEKARKKAYRDRKRGERLQIDWVRQEEEAEFRERCYREFGQILDAGLMVCHTAGLREAWVAALKCGAPVLKEAYYRARVALR